jgi:hypothetical protein
MMHQDGTGAKVGQREAASHFRQTFNQLVPNQHARHVFLIQTNIKVPFNTKNIQ